LRKDFWNAVRRRMRRESDVKRSKRRTNLTLLLSSTITGSREFVRKHDHRKLKETLKVKLQALR
jgi:hypothetical protein